MLAVDRDGRIYVSDGTIKLYGADGHFIRTVGRNGEGPGEYRDAMLATARNQLVVQDPALGRLTLFDSAGQYLRSWRTDCCRIFPPGFTTAGDIMIWVSGTGTSPGETYARYGLDGASRSSLELPPAPAAKLWKVTSGFGGIATAIPFTPVRQVAFHPAGGLVHGWSTEYTIVWSRTGRDTVLVFGRGGSPSLLSQSRRQAAVNYLKEWYTRNQANFGGVDAAELNRVMTVDDVPTTAPAYSGIEVDGDGNFWVRQDSEDSLRSHYEVFNDRGVYRGPVVAPAVLKGNGRAIWTRSAVYSIQDIADGSPVIRRYRIERQKRD
jgi:hypothetical protein